jgi:hypothetical protein
MPKNLLLQMNNCVKDNKNQHLLAFLSLLMVKDVFEEVKLDFWRVGIAQNLAYEMKMKVYMEYWEDIVLHLLRSLPPQSPTLLEGFWPSSNQRSNYAKLCCQLLWKLLMQKIQFNFLIVDWKT